MILPTKRGIYGFIETIWYGGYQDKIGKSFEISKFSIISRTSRRSVRRAVSFTQVSVVLGTSYLFFYDLVHTNIVKSKIVKLKIGCVNLSQNLSAVNATSPVLENL